MKRAALVATALAGLASGTWLRAHRASPAVASWTPPTLPRTVIGDLSVCHGGEGPGVLLLHGLVATGDVFGSTVDVLARTNRVAVPDLLGFGRSLDMARSDFGTEAHLAAIDAVVAEVLGDRPLRIGAHSMGCALALRWAARHPDRVEHVVCIGAPVWSSPDAAAASLGAAGPMARAFVLDERVASRICAFSCDHRSLAGWLAAAGAPRWPVPIARQASLHTWPAYRQALVEAILDTDWSSLLADLDRAGVDVTLVWGQDDLIGDPGFALDLARRLDHVKVQMIDGDHTLPAARPDLLVDLL